MIIRGSGRARTLFLETQETKVKFARGTRMILALPVVCSEIEAFRTSSLTGNLHVLLMVKWCQAERQHRLIDAFFATRELVVLHSVHIPKAAAKKAKDSVADALLQCSHGLVHEYSATVNTTLTVNVLLQLLLVLQSL